MILLYHLVVSIYYFLGSLEYPDSTELIQFYMLKEYVIWGYCVIGKTSLGWLRKFSEKIEGVFHNEGKDVFRGWKRPKSGICQKMAMSCLRSSISICVKCHGKAEMRQIPLRQLPCKNWCASNAPALNAPASKIKEKVMGLKTTSHWWNGPKFTFYLKKIEKKLKKKLKKKNILRHLPWK